MTTHRPLIEALLNPDVYSHPVEHCQLIETHISWVIIAGDYAYKLKKPVDLGFLDFSTLKKRQFYCQEELRLNHRLAPDIYLDVVAINGSEQQPAINGDGDVIEYAVKMKAFEQSAQVDVMLERGELHEHHIDSFARRIAQFHQNIQSHDTDNDYGMPEHVNAPIQENFRQIRKHVSNKKIIEQLEPIHAWSDKNYKALKPALLKRKQDGFVRECHGDMHCRNLAWVDDKPVIFDCIEFNAELRWIDVISEIAFLVMDLNQRRCPEYAWRLLNAWLEQTGDYAALQLLPFYLVYRALVRAKVSAIRSSQNDLSREQHHDIEQDIVRYLEQAKHYTVQTQPQLIITRGLSGSGKSTVTGPLLQQLPAIRLRSDIERKRLFGLDAESDAAAAIGEGIYSSETTARTYHVLAQCAADILEAGYSVIVDATFLDAKWRRLFRQVALQQDVSFVILNLEAEPEILKQRVAARSKDASDAGLEVLEQQLANRQPLADSEREDVVELDTSTQTDARKLVNTLKNKQKTAAEDVS